MTVGQNVRAKRLAAGIGQAKLADAVGISKTALVNIEVRGADPRSETLRRLAEALGCSADELLGRAS